VSFIGFLLIGLVAGMAAAWVTRVKRRGCLTNTLTGVVGALIGGLVLDGLGVDGPGLFLTALLGAIILLVILRLIGLAARR
jgi:uncharacterized membrane protein YeaQ/YmgE (transglycosylase-associated protein family)